jgi:hypothetical protein
MTAVTSLEAEHVRLYYYYTDELSSGQFITVIVEVQKVFNKLHQQGGTFVLLFLSVSEIV